MPRGYRYIIVTAFGWLSLTGASPPNNARQHQQTAEKREQPPAPEADYAPYPDKNANACYTAKQHDSADLCAQWRSALAAEKAAEVGIWGNWIGAIGAILSFIGTVLIIWTLRLTRDANRISRGAGRPWITVNGTVIKTAEGGKWDGIERRIPFIVFAIDLRISGDRPAFVRKATTDYRVTDSCLIPPIFEKPLQDTVATFVTGVGLSSGSCAPSDQELAGILSREKFLWMYAKYVFVDPNEPSMERISEITGYFEFSSDGPNGPVFYFHQVGLQNRIT